MIHLKLIIYYQQKASENMRGKSWNYVTNLNFLEKTEVFPKIGLKIGRYKT